MVAIIVFGVYVSCSRVVIGTSLISLAKREIEIKLKRSSYKAFAPISSMPADACAYKLQGLPTGGQYAIPQYTNLPTCDVDNERQRQLKFPMCIRLTSTEDCSPV